jgi:hypothetical protein
VLRANASEANSPSGWVGPCVTEGATGGCQLHHGLTNRRTRLAKQEVLDMGECKRGRSRAFMYVKPHSNRVSVVAWLVGFGKPLHSLK